MKRRKFLHILGIAPAVITLTPVVKAAQTQLVHVPAMVVGGDLQDSSLCYYEYPDQEVQATPTKLFIAKKEIGVITSITWEMYRLKSRINMCIHPKDLDPLRELFDGNVRPMALKLPDNANFEFSGEIESYHTCTSTHSPCTLHVSVLVYGLISLPDDDNDLLL